jgi:uncharacterized lipoprotein
VKTVGYIIIASLFVTACSSSYYARNGEQHYLKSRNGPPLVVPKFMTTANISHFYDLPPQTENAKVSIAPPAA